ncbi:MAG: AAA family ATPase [Gammaproteobacteria bacterium]|nr:AAA family ATPase [Gammaproteobacteria bacterium]
MRIAVSGTHSVGKSTMVNDFVQAFPNYIHEEEPYRALRDYYNIKFGKESTRFCNGLQLYYSISRAKQYCANTCDVIFDRCPVDYIAYSKYTANYRETDIDDTFIESFVTPVKEALSFIDILLFVPITEKHPVAFEEDGIRPTDRQYRIEVDDIFKKIYYENAYDVMPPNPPKLVEIWGNREERIAKINQAILEFL